MDDHALFTTLSAVYPVQIPDYGRSLSKRGDEKPNIAKTHGFTKDRSGFNHLSEQQFRRTGKGS